MNSIPDTGDGGLVLMMMMMMYRGENNVVFGELMSSRSIKILSHEKIEMKNDLGLLFYYSFSCLQFTTDQLNWLSI